MATRKSKITISIVVAAFLLMLIPIVRELRIQKYIYDFEHEVTIESFFFGLEEYEGLKEKAFDRFLLTEAGKRYIHKKFKTLVFSELTDYSKKVIDSKLVKNLGKTKKDIRAIVLAKVYKNALTAVVFDDVIVAVDFSTDDPTGNKKKIEEILKTYPQYVKLEPELWPHLIKLTDSYLDRCGGIDRLQTREGSKICVSMYNLQETKLPDWYKELGWPEEGFMEIKFIKSRESKFGVPKFKLPKGKKYKIIKVTKKSELDP